MPGSANLNPNILVDSLVPMIDSLKASLYGNFGVRPFRVFAVLRSWSGQMMGEGDYTDVVTELSPPPKVERWDGYKWVMLAHGINEDGTVRMTDVSLSYTYNEIGAGFVDQDDRNQQFFFYLVDAYGQKQEPRSLKHNKPPHINRGEDSSCDIGWICWLTNINLPDGKAPEIPEAP
jgi:hypothetical protein